MKPDRKRPTSKARVMLRKLQALAERGVDGEKFAAQRKIERLKQRFDFDAPGAGETPDLFRGTFKASSKARWIYSFPSGQFEVGNSVKWAIESSTGIKCLYRDRDLLAEAAPDTVNRLSRIAEHISQSFQTLVSKYNTVNGVSAADRGVFIMGLYDGMMNDSREAGQPLPGRPGTKRQARGRKTIASQDSHLHLHPYSLALGLGRQIRFSVPLLEITAELENLTQRRLTNEAARSHQQNAI